MRSRKDLESVDYKCPLLKGTAHIKLKYTIIDKPYIRKLIQFDCEECISCGVGTKSGNVWSFDWCKCVHPNLQNNHNTGQKQQPSKVPLI